MPAEFAVSGAMLGHVLKRGISAGQASFLSAAQNPAVMEKLQQDAQAYEEAGPGSEINPQDFWPVLITIVFFGLIFASIRYTLGDVMASLAMIESPSSIAIVEPKPPAYSDEPDAPLEKDSHMDAEPDVEVTVINHKPITGKITTTIRHMHRIGGFFSRWRGLRYSVMYHGFHSLFMNVLAAVFGFNLIAHFALYPLVSVLLSRLHMVWTHAMVAHPTTKSLRARFLTRAETKPLILPTLVFALAQQATLLLPIGVAFLLRLHEVDIESFKPGMDHQDCSKFISLTLRVLAVPATASIVAFTVLLPASVTLTRIEAALLPEDMQTIVPFNREALVGELDLSDRNGRKALFTQAWRSFDGADRVRLIKLYVKMVAAQFTVGIVGLHVMAAQIYFIGGERIAVFLKSAHAQLQLMAIEASKDAAQSGN